MMTIEHKESGDHGKFLIRENDREIALMTYQRSSQDRMTINHTEVDPNFRGEGLGRDLVAEGVEFAKRNNLKIVPLCPFARKVIDRTPEFQAVLV